MITQLFIFVLMYFLATSLSGISKVRQDRLYLLNHPWALGVFLAETLPIIFIDQPTGLARDLTWTLVVFSSSILVSGSLNIRLRWPALCFLAACVTVPGLLKMVPLPNPLFRIYWAVYDPDRNSSLFDMGKATAQQSTAKKGVFSGIYAGWRICHGPGHSVADSRFCQPL